MGAVGLRGKSAVNSLNAFGWGCAGSFAIEVVLFCDAVRNRRANRIPALYRRPAFILGRALSRRPGESRNPFRGWPLVQGRRSS